jgi:hypothetical protein
MMRQSRLPAKLHAVRHGARSLRQRGRNVDLARQNLTPLAARGWRRSSLNAGFDRRLTRDFKRYAKTVAAFVRLAMIRLMLKRLTKPSLCS